MISSSYVITSSQLKTFNETAHEERQNRILPIKDKYSSNSDEEELDMSKNAVVKPLLFHTNYEGKQSWRCQVVYGVQNDEEPRTAYLDVSLKHLDELKKHTLRDELTKKLRNAIKAKRG